jgi:hypothetical protein
MITPEQLTELRTKLEKFGYFERDLVVRLVDEIVRLKKLVGESTEVPTPPLSEIDKRFELQDTNRGNEFLYVVGFDNNVAFGGNTAVFVDTTEPHVSVGIAIKISEHDDDKETDEEWDDTDLEQSFQSDREAIEFAIKVADILDEWRKTADITTIPACVEKLEILGFTKLEVSA